MRALTLKQPWLYAIEHLGKRVENRSWAIPKNLRDQWIALHAGKANEMSEWLVASQIHGQLITGDVTFGAVTSVAKFSHVVAFASIKLSTPDDIRKWAFGPYVWMISDLLMLESAIPCRGMLGLWTVPGDIEEKIKAQLPSLAIENRQKELHL